MLGQLVSKDLVVRARGGVAQLAAHLLCKQGVTGSSPVASTHVFAGQGPKLLSWTPDLFRHCPILGAEWERITGVVSR